VTSQRLLVLLMFLFIAMSAFNYVYYREQLSGIERLAQALVSESRQSVNLFDPIAKARAAAGLTPVSTGYYEGRAIAERNHFVNREIALGILAGVGLILLYRRR